MLILILLIYILYEKQMLNLSYTEMLTIELVVLILLILEIKFIVRWIEKKTKFKKK